DSVPLPWLQDLLLTDFPELGRTGLRDPIATLFQRLERLRLLVPQVQRRAPAPGIAPGDARLARTHRLVQAVISARAPEAARAARTERVNRSALERAELFAAGWSSADRSWECAPLRDFGLLAMRRDDPRAVNVIQWLAEPLQYLTSVAETA